MTRYEPWLLFIATSEMARLDQERGKARYAASRRAARTEAKTLIESSRVSRGMIGATNRDFPLNHWGTSPKYFCGGSSDCLDLLLLHVIRTAQVVYV